MRVSRWQAFQYLLIRHNVVVAVGIFCLVRGVMPSCAAFYLRATSLSCSTKSMSVVGMPRGGHY